MSNSKAAVMRSMPNPKRPRLSVEAEEKFADIERRTAACYAESENLTAQLNQMAQMIDDSIVEDAIPEVTPSFDDISTVNHIEEVRAKITTGDQTPIPKAGA